MPTTALPCDPCCPTFIMLSNLATQAFHPPEAVQEDWARQHRIYCERCLKYGISTTH